MCDREDIVWQGEDIGCEDIGQERHASVLVLLLLQSLPVAWQWVQGLMLFSV